VEDWYIGRVIDHADGNLAHASRVLGVDRSTVRRRAKQAKKSK
jgi:DNA-binding protein Fis